MGFERPSGEEERAVGAELRLMEEGHHILVGDPHCFTSCFLCVSFLLKQGQSLMVRIPNDSQNLSRVSCPPCRCHLDFLCARNTCL